MERVIVTVWHGEARSIAYIMGEESQECYASLSDLGYSYLFRAIAQELADGVNAGILTTDDLADYQ